MRHAFFLLWRWTDEKINQCSDKVTADCASRPTTPIGQSPPSPTSSNCLILSAVEADRGEPNTRRWGLHCSRARSADEMDGNPYLQVYIVLSDREGDSFVVHLITLAHVQDVLLAQINRTALIMALETHFGRGDQNV